MSDRNDNNNSSDKPKLGIKGDFKRDGFQKNRSDSRGDSAIKKEFTRDDFKKTSHTKPLEKRGGFDRDELKDDFKKKDKYGPNPSPIRVMEGAILKAGRYLKRDYGEIENLQVSRKGSGSFVTSADLKAEKIVVEELQEYFPDYPIISEEAGLIGAENSKFCFILDPIDGTTNFMHGMPYFCISLALQETQPDGTKEIIAGAVYAPILEEIYMAQKGEGATCNNKKLYVSARNKMEDGVFAAYLAKYDKEQRACDQAALNSAILHTRIMGSAALELCFVAAGKLEGMWHWRLKPWDIAAGSLMVKEARGMVSEIDGGDNYLETGSIVASNSEIFETLRGKIQPCYSKK